MCDIQIYKSVSRNQTCRRKILLDDGGKSCFESGANAAISGDMLTTTGETVMSDMQLIKSLGFTAGLLDEVK